ncbi:hypothetical protein BN7_6537 [Wickerhamomyces ciferrii]|uniref:Uncharacterized protein n=1 Tax=Wickerhamomyces ciferrii (strain ATCC 14091 / BCRC 22168 / CBS 111 / JCM 3599 / NBRC 0793 / NRRL Y-1031 F-60-10) TaxID=1206466 RepID=K0KUQ6_WICCF|nr:uncharacterized protein BN7_6537 [Wickerhamomyces ciferrii]CCH46931.1 hypothetical protein BN7_6537 [Wickerhamomyces ciferrii]
MSTSFDSEFESFESSNKNDVSKKNQNYYIEHENDYINQENFGESTQNYIQREGNDQEVLESIEKINNLLSWNDQLSIEINNKFQQFENVNIEVIQNLEFLQNHINKSQHKQLKEPKFIQKKSKSYLPTPEDEIYHEKNLEFEIQGISKQNQSTPNLQSLPSSPELDHIEPIRTNGSEIEEIEIELNDKISRLVSQNYNNENILKLKNIVNSTFELLRFENDQDNLKLMNFNNEINEKSSGLINKLYGLVESFT